MEQKYLDKKSNAICPKCHRRLINANGKYCNCYESKLPKPTKSSVSAHSTDAIEVYSERIEAWIKKTEVSKAAWTRRLKEHGLSDHEVELILLRFLEDMEFKEIVKKCGWVSVDVCSYAYRKAISKLRKRGFSFG